MDRIEKVLKGLECCLWGSDWDKKCDECPYEATEDEKKHVDWDCHLNGLREDALALLKEHEPRVLTLEELRQLEETDHFVWVENNGDEDCFDGFGEITISILSNSVEIFQFGNEVEWKPCNDDYCKTWRCWSARPTDEQRKAVKWE